jgi:hypothetical protein
VTAIDTDPSTGRARARLRLYAEGAPEREGGVGVPAEEVVVIDPADALSPIALGDRDDGDGRATHDRVDRCARLLCASVHGMGGLAQDGDPERRLRAACACPAWTGPDDPGSGCPLDGTADAVAGAHGSAAVAATGIADAAGSQYRRRTALERDRVLSAVTAPLPEGAIRRVTLVHDGTHRSDVRTDPMRCPRPVVVVATGLPGGVVRYGLAPLSPARVVQSAVLCAHGLPLTPACYDAVEWSRWPRYRALVAEASEHRRRAMGDADEVPVDSVWLYRLVSELVRRGYRVSPVDLAAD